ncbi:MAG: hypothetical protein JW928_07230 [Candidatus Aureabacteria bacterium]|nr:hypothetical protein [Candidatus Auribacterota bacterium]
MRAADIKLLFSFLIFLFLAGCSKPPEVSEVSQTAVNPSYPPLQKQYTGTQVFTKQFPGADFTIRPLQSYEVSARVVSKKNYGYWTWQGRLAPVDLALAWEELSKPHYVKFVSFSQRSRWYYFRLKSDAPFDTGFVYERSSNNHIIPHNDNVLRALRRVRKNNIIKLAGYLVRVDGKWNGRAVWWQSSTSRSDTGDGSCEVIYATSLQKKDKIYR